MTPSSIPSHEDLVAKLKNTEDSSVERKSKSDRGGWLKTAVAFANSLPVGFPGVLFIGVNDSGQIGDNGNIEDIMKSFSDFLVSHAWPPLYSLPHILTHEGKSCIAVIIPGSENRPHFAGRAYVRDGTQTRDASEEQFERLIAERQSIVRKLREWEGKRVRFQAGALELGLGVPRFERILKECNQFYVTLATPRIQMLEAEKLDSFPLRGITLSYDHQFEQLLLIYVSSRV